MKTLVTGGSGFIGTILVGDLKDAGLEIVIYDKRISSKYQHLCSVADVRDKKRLTEASKGCDVIYHLAAEHRDDVQPISLYQDVNVGGAKNLVYAAEKNNINKIIFTSSVALYGLNVGIPDESFPAIPFNAYGTSKYEAELVFQRWAAKGKDRSLVVVRPVVIFGEENRGNVYNLLTQIVSRRFFMVGNGNNKKSMGYVRNFSKFLLRSLELKSGIHVFNYADKPDLKTSELISIATKALGIPIRRYRIPYPIGLIGGYIFDGLSKITNRTYPISLIRIKKFCANTQVAADKIERLGFSAPYTLEEGLVRMIQKDFIGRAQNQN